MYKEEAIALFCDGSVHDSPEQKKQDKIERYNFRYNASYQVLILRYDENWREKLQVLGSLLPDCLRKNL